MMTGFNQNTFYALYNSQTIKNRSRGGIPPEEDKIIFNLLEEIFSYLESQSTNVNFLEKRKEIFSK